MPNVMTFEFKETTEVPERASGGPGRQRMNPFDAKVRDSFERKFYELSPESPRGRWYEIVVPTDQVPKVYAKIRNAGQYQDLGTNLEHDTHDGNGNYAGDGQEFIWFRGAPKQSRGKAEDAMNGNARNDVENYEDYDD